MKTASELLESQVIIIAGGCGRIGSSFVRAVLRHGGTGIIADADEKRGNEIAASAPDQIRFIKTNLTDPLSVDNLITECDRYFGRIDAFVNSSYPRNENWGAKFEDVQYGDFCENISLHLGSYFLCAQKIAGYFLAHGGGSIVHIASILGVVAPKFDAYAAARFEGREMTSPAEYSMIKAGIIHFTRYLAKYYKDKNIRVNCISPGGILSGQSENFLVSYGKHCARKGMLDPEDIDGSLVFLLSGQSTFVTGQNIIVDDGWSL